MGQPEGEFSDYNTDQYEQKDYQYDASQGQEDFTAQTFEQACYDSSQQDQTNTANDPQPQPQPQPQQGQHQPPPQPFQQQRPPQQYPQQPQQTNPAFGPGPRQGRPMPYPPQNPQTSPVYPQQGRPMQPVNFPPQSPQANPMFGAQAQPGYSPVVPQGYQVPQSQPVQFPPPQSPLQQQHPYNIPNSPIKPNGNMAAPGVPVNITQQAYNQGWKTGLFDFMDDPMNALITAFFPCVTFGQVAEIVDNGNTSCGTSGMLYGLIAFCIAMPCIMSCSYRTKLRARFGLIESPAPDWVTHFFCEPCALCQEYRELNLRGIDPSIGWQGNAARQMQQPQIAMVAPPNQRMMP